MEKNGIIYPESPHHEILNGTCQQFQQLSLLSSVTFPLKRRRLRVREVTDFLQGMQLEAEDSPGHRTRWRQEDMGRR